MELFTRKTTISLFSAAAAVLALSTTAWACTGLGAGIDATLTVTQTSPGSRAITAVVVNPPAGVAAAGIAANATPTLYQGDAFAAANTLKNVDIMPCHAPGPYYAAVGSQTVTNPEPGVHVITATANGTGVGPYTFCAVSTDTWTSNPVVLAII